MLQFVATNVLMISVGTILYLVIRSLPRIGEHESTHPKGGILERWITSDVPMKIDASLNTFLGKFLRKLKVSLLKVDNLLTDRLKKITKEGNGKPKIDFKDIMEGKSSDES